MPSTKGKKDKNKLITVPFEDDNEDHELSYYMNDRIRMMKEVLKVIKPKKIKSMAPNCIKDLDVEEINSMLLEELLGVSNKRLRHILNGENVDEESSSTETEEEKQPVDIISLDDISDSEDDFDFSGDNLKTNNKKNKDLVDKKIIKKEKVGKNMNKKKNKSNDLTENDKVMSVLELLELQARARAIRSQLAIENAKKDESKVEQEIKNEDSDPDAIIVESPKLDEIIIGSSDSENEKSKADSSKKHKKHISEADNVPEVKKSKKVKIVRDYIITEKVQEADKSTSEKIKPDEVKSQPVGDEVKNDVLNCLSSENNEKPKEVTNQSEETNKLHEKSDSETDGIVINVDEDEMDGIVNV